MNNAYFRSFPYFFRGGYQTINIFNNGKWESLCNTFNFEPGRVNASSLDSVWCYGGGGSSGISFWLWNNSKWTLEYNFYRLCYGGPRIFPPSGPSSMMEVVDGKIYLMFENYNNNSSYFLKGKPILRKEADK